MSAQQMAAAPELIAFANNFEIVGPDDDGLVWLVLHGNGTTGSAMFNLGAADRIAVQVALLFEVDRRSALAKHDILQQHPRHGKLLTALEIIASGNTDPNRMVEIASAAIAEVKKGGV